MDGSGAGADRTGICGVLESNGGESGVWGAVSFDGKTRTIFREPFFEEDFGDVSSVRSIAGRYARSKGPIISITSKRPHDGSESAFQSERWRGVTDFEGRRANRGVAVHIDRYMWGDVQMRFL